MSLTHPFGYKNSVPRTSAIKEKGKKDHKPKKQSLALNDEKRVTYKGNKASQHSKLFGRDGHVESHRWKKIDV